MNSIIIVLVIITGHSRVEIRQNSLEECRFALMSAYQKRPPVTIEPSWTAHCEEKRS